MHHLVIYKQKFCWEGKFSLKDQDSCGDGRARTFETQSPVSELPSLIPPPCPSICTDLATCFIYCAKYEV